MARKLAFRTEAGFSLYHLASKLEKMMELEGLYVSSEEPSCNTLILKATNANGSKASFLRNISGTKRSISLYFEESGDELFVYMDDASWEDKGVAFLLGIFFEPLWFTAGYGAIRQASLEEKIIQTIQNEVHVEERKEVDFSMNIRQRIELATPIISLIIFLTMGYVFGMWGYGALAFLLIPLMPIILGEISVDFIFPFVVCAAYLGLGFGLGAWHPAWILFLTIPVYFIIFPARHKPLRCMR